MGSHWSPHSGRAEVRKRIEALVQPMPEHEVAAVDFDSQLSLGPVSAKVVVAIVAAVALLVAVMAGCAMGEDEPTPGPGGVSGSGELGELPGTAGEGTAMASADSGDMEPAEGGGNTERSSATDQEVVVSVQGMVRTPGLLILGGNTRVGEAIDRAGGTLPDASVLSINLAEAVVDGMQIVITKEGSHVLYPGQAGEHSSGSEGNPGGISGRGGTPGPAATHSAASGGRDSAPGEGLVNINTADATALQTLDGVGPATAEAIIAWREDNGAFSTVEQLMEVRGIGPAKFEAMKNDVTVK